MAAVVRLRVETEVELRWKGDALDGRVREWMVAGPRLMGVEAAALAVAN